MQAFKSLERFLFLPELELIKISTERRTLTEYYLDKVSKFEVCPKYATPSHSIYDRRTVRIRDEAIRNKRALLVIRKRRFWCKKCYKPFTEPVSGISKNGRMTNRLKLSIFNSCREFSSLSSVQKKLGVQVELYIKRSIQS